MGIKEYWLCEASDDCDVAGGPFTAWDSMLKSEDMKMLETRVTDDDIHGYFYLITEPGKRPMIGGILPGMKDPSV